MFKAGLVAHRPPRLCREEVVMFLYEFKVVEHFGGEQAPEDFGYEWLAYPPAVGDEIQLYWLGRRPAYRVKVLRVYEEEMVLHVEKV